MRFIFKWIIDQIPVKKLVFLDESGVNEDLTRTYGRSLRGKMIEDVKRGRLFYRTNIIGAVCDKKHLTIKVYDNPTNAAFFERWFNEELIEKLEKGSFIIMDNARFHRKKVLQEIANKHKMQLLFLPPYSPDLNQIEKSWANMKKWLRSNAFHHTKLQESIYTYFYDTCLN